MAKPAYDKDWTKKMSLRRAELVDKEYASKLSPAELAELESLQEKFGQFQDRHWPLPGTNDHES